MINKLISVGLIQLACLVFIAVKLNGQAFEKRYGSEQPDSYQAMTETPDGNFVFAGFTSGYGNGGQDVFIVKTNSNGNLLWSRVLGGSGNDLAYGVAAEGNGNILVAGKTNSSGAGSDDAWLVKLDPFGKVLWTRTYGGTGMDYFRGLAMVNGKYFLAGATTVAGPAGLDMYLIKTDTSGNVLMSKTYGYAGDDYANGITATHSGQLVMAGRTSHFGVTSPVYVVKVKTNGDTLWTRNFNENNSSSSNVYATGVTVLKDKNYLVTGFGYPYNGGYGNMFHLKIDTSGNSVYSNWSGLLADIGNAVCATSDSGYVVCSQYCNYGCRVNLRKYNSSGVSLWQKNYLPGYGLTYNDYSNGLAVIETDDKGLAVAGNTNWTSGGADALFIRTDSAGNSFTYTPPAITASDTLVFCSNDSVILSAPGGYTTYQWIRYTGNSATYLDKTGSLKVTTSGSYYCVMSDNQGIYVSGTAGVSVYSNSTPSITYSGFANYCAAAGQTLTLTVPAGYTYQWKLNGSAISGATTNTYVPVAAGNISVQCTNICGTFNTSAIPANPAAPPVAQPVYCNSANCDVYACNASTPELRVNDLGAGITYNWQLNGTTVQSGSSYAYYPSAAGLYTCIASSVCGSDTATGYNVNYIPQGSFTIYPSTPTTGCGLTSAVLNSPFSISGGYQWYIYGNPIPGATDAQYIATVSGDYTVDFFDYFCGYSVTDPLTVSLTGTAPFITAGGPTQVCAGTVTLTAGITGPGVTYNWYKDNVQLSGATASSYSASVTGNYACFIYNPACGGGWSNSMEVIIGMPAGTASIGSSGICAGNNTSVSFATARSGYTYQWKHNGAILPGATASSGSVALAGTYTCDVSNTCGTITTNGVSLTINALPPATATAQGSTALCPAGSVILSANAGGGYTYQWFRNNISQSGATLQNYTVTTAGSYKVQVTNSSGCSSLSSPDILVTSITPPVSSARALDYPRICSGSTVALKAGTAAGYNYQWKKNGVNISGATDSVYQAGAAGLYSVITSNTCGTAVSGTVEVSQVASPSPVITPSGATSFCSGGQVTLTINATAGSGYQWKKNGSSIPGATNFSYSATTSGNYKAVKINSFGCTGTSAATAVTAYTNPAPTVTPQGPTTFCAGDSVQLKANFNSNYAYQWKKNNSNIAGATSNKYEAKTAGNYKVKETNANGCTNISAAIFVNVPCRNTEFMAETTDQEVVIYPNPNNGEFTVKFSNKRYGSVQIELTDAIGRVVKRFEMDDEAVVIKESNLENGIYCLIAHTKDHVLVKKFNVVR